MNGIYSGFFKIPQKVMDMVNQDKCKVIFSYESEGDLDVKILMIGFINQLYFERKN